MAISEFIGNGFIIAVFIWIKRCLNTRVGRDIIQPAAMVHTVERNTE